MSRQILNLAASAVIYSRFSSQRNRPYLKNRFILLLYPYLNSLIHKKLIQLFSYQFYFLTEKNTVRTCSSASVRRSVNKIWTVMHGEKELNVLSWRPVHLSATENVDVNVVHRLSAVDAIVDYNSVALISVIKIIKFRIQPSSSFSCSAHLRATLRRCPKIPASASVAFESWGILAFGITRKWTGACGLISRKARAASSS